jgi:hypothetical protein
MKSPLALALSIVCVILVYAWCFGLIGGRFWGLVMFWAGIVLKICNR